MRASLASLKLGTINPNLLGMIQVLARNSVRQAVDAADVAAIVDNSGGNNAAAVAVPTINTRAVPAGANLASRAGFNAAIGTIDAGIGELVDKLAAFYTAVGGTAPTLGDHPAAAGNGTIEAITTGGAAVDGTAGDALLRLDANAAISRQRNNLATAVKAYNVVATALGVATIPNNSGGKANQDLTFNASVTATTAVAAGAVATSDLASAADATASLTALRNNIAYVANKINTVLNAAGSFAIEPIILEP
jgi:hypothetical protein